jgi:nucleoside-diphosphate-sugar epimerase
MAQLADPGKSASPGNRLLIGCGYLGERVARRWLDQGQTVFATTRRRIDGLRRLGLIPILADVTRADMVPMLPEASTVVIAFAIDRTTGQSPREVYVGGVVHLLPRLPASARVIFVSSTGVYGGSTENAVDETTPVAPTDETSRAIVEAEQQLRRARPEAIILRFAGIYGPGRLLREKAVLRGEPLPTDPDGWLNLIHVEDGARAIVAAEQMGKPGEVYNISDGHPVRRGDFYRRLAQLLHAPEPTFVPPTSEERASRRISSRRMMQDLRVALEYPTYVQGLAACFY